MPDLVLEQLRKIREEQTKSRLRDQDIVSKLDRLQTDVSVIRGDVGSLKHDTNLLNERYYNLEARLETLDERVEALEKQKRLEGAEVPSKT